MADQEEPESGSKIQYSSHHYALAHIALRQNCFINPFEFFMVMARQRREPFLMDLWDEIKKNCDKDGPASFSIEDIKITITTIKTYPFIFIEMPQPQRMPEAHFIGIVLQVPLAKIQDDLNKHKMPSTNISVRYFTLEMGIDLKTKKARTALCEWTKNSHLYLGDGPEPNAEAFIREIERIL